MKILLLAIAKTTEKYLIEGEQEYLSRLKHYTQLEYKHVISKKHSTNEVAQRELESDLILQELQPTDHVVLLDERGAERTSVDLADWMEKHQVKGTKRIVFVVGGAFGFSETIYSRANDKLSLSKLTFSHQMVRLIFLEQLYRAFTILRREKYHHE